METKTIVIIVVIALLLVGGVLVWFVGKPMFNKYIENKQIEAKDIVLTIIIQQIQEQGYVSITDKDGNKLVLVPARQGEQ